MTIKESSVVGNVPIKERYSSEKERIENVNIVKSLFMRWLQEYE